MYYTYACYMLFELVNRFGADVPLNLLSNLSTVMEDGA